MSKADQLESFDMRKGVIGPPVSYDRQVHTPIRRKLEPLRSPAAVREREDYIRVVADEWIDSFISDGQKRHRRAVLRSGPHDRRARLARTAAMLTPSSRARPLTPAMRDRLACGQPRRRPRVGCSEAHSLADDVEHDLVGATVDALHPSVPPQPGDLIFVDVAVAAVQLHGTDRRCATASRSTTTSLRRPRRR